MPRLLSTVGAALLGIGLAGAPGDAQETPILIVTTAGRCLVAMAERETAEVRTGDCGSAAPLRTVAGTVRTEGGRCLDWTNQGGPVHLAECRIGRATQQWRFEPNGLIRNGARGDLCMDVEGGGTDDGTRVLAWPCQDLSRPHPNQRFRRAAPRAAAPDSGAGHAAGGTAEGGS
ncbi:MAG: RICIN domain-containing protein [Gemmatimonadetes bacterium]|nr:RICIN domain-containing protein [Gemmatimonadota bacterium]